MYCWALPSPSAAVSILCQKTHGVFPYSLSHQTRVTSVPALSGAKANQVQPGIHSCRKLKYSVTAVTWLLVRGWLGWWQKHFSMSYQSAKDCYSLGLRSPENQAHVRNGGFSYLLSAFICSSSDLWGQLRRLFVGPQNQRLLSKTLVKVFSTKSSFGTSRDKSHSKGPAGKMLSYFSTYRRVLQHL